MIWELVRSGRLPQWWEYLVLVACVLIAAAGPVAIWAIWTTRPKRVPDGGQ